MEAYNFCQSCGMPLDSAEVLGTEKDGSKSCKYCRYCYQAGAFAKPEMTFEEMKDIVRVKLQEMKMPEDIIKRAVEGLPYLERWIGRPVCHDR